MKLKSLIFRVVFGTVVVIAPFTVPFMSAQTVQFQPYTYYDPFEEIGVYVSYIYAPDIANVAYQWNMLSAGRPERFQMLLWANNDLSLYSVDMSNESIKLSPGEVSSTAPIPPHIQITDTRDASNKILLRPGPASDNDSGLFINGSRVLTESGAGTTFLSANPIKLAGGSGSSAAISDSFAFGEGAKATLSGQLAGGRWNDAEAVSGTDPVLFMVGNGTSDSERSNAFTVTHSGDVKAAGVIRVKAAGDLTMGAFTAPAWSEP